MTDDLGKFINGRVVSELEKRGVTEADINLVVEKGEVLAVDIFVDAFLKCLQRVKEAFRTMTGGTRTTDEVVAAGNYDWVNSMVNGDNFPMRPMPDGPREIVFLEFDHDTTSEEALAEAERQGLERPLYEDALFFGEQHPEEQRKDPIVFLHEPWQDPCGNLSVLVLDCGDRYRYLRLGYFGDSWDRRCRFAFVRK
ncbi:hypothetical protein A2524_02505 [Candidatus Wolfebacteria bacterium RIFOXYD12_FULL_48_21]|uniref:Uncharacterized protein n=1 Tax=Candidatus Wolfebacteria bacterium RIFOXYD1_FULL_48_65 TaxID=1802561 RepID=A0A1F8E085_9BACT|nr:MAG: hypothetical protein A2610_01175 [Candidatus Wolfebacteria bacterium RIFOXYD1_FULL_48_65]OGM94739.1 MAG: hypothetical protein A2524_02505 [Candidatus Wolfebacteria bacterium RIFOXYD12_FULL_48_21]OGM95704.1 MAG: hypothetical protein A2532_03605 [Candidatus Wolfebacteria bacterium RIFOXYD2_FULL_48_11]